MDFCLLLEIWVKMLVKKISKNVSSKYRQKLLHHDKQSATDAFKTASQKVIQKAVEATGDLIRNKIADEIIRVSKANDEKEETIREKCICLEERQKIIDDLQLI